MKYRIGLDIGIASIGWSVIEHNEKDEPARIVDLGVRVFSPAENPKDGSSLAVARREARGLRRRLRRKVNRIEKAKEYLKENLLDGKEETNINKDIFFLRNKAINEIISNEDLYSVIVYLIKHRGFKSNRKSEISDGESGQVLKNISKNKTYMLEKGYRTVGECIYNDKRFKYENGDIKVRNHPTGINGAYQNCFGREELEAELLYILDKQQEFGNKKITNQFIDIILSLFNKQRSFDEGPNEPSKYKASFAVGTDTFFEPNEFRAPKGSFTFEYFNALQKLNHLQIVKNSEKCALNKEQIKVILEKLMQGSALTYSQIRKYLGMKEGELFGGISYFVKPKKDEETPSFDEIVEKCEKSKFFDFQFTKKIAKVLNLKNFYENKHLIDAIGLILSMRKSDQARINAFKCKDEIINRLSDLQLDALKQLTDEQIENILILDTSKFGSLSFKAMNNIIPFLEEGYTYDKACDKAGYSFAGIYGKNKGKKIVWAKLEQKLQEVTSPVVLRSISQTVKVVNAIIDKYGSPCAIFVELAREMSKSFDERRKILKENEDRKSQNEKIISHLKSLGINPSGQDIVKFRLYEEQGQKCAYSGKSFESVLGNFKNIFTNATQVDHIIPYSKCFDDSYNNKVLVLAEENQRKGNKLPKEYMSEEQFAKFEEFVNAVYKNNYKKRQRLLKSSLSEEENKELNNRALNDTKHSAKFVLGMLKDNLEFADSKFNKSPVRAINGGMTSYLRKVWGINKIRFENDRHHAIDASVIACCTNSMINTVSKYLKLKLYRENKNKYKLEMVDGQKKYIIEDEVLTEDEYDRMFAPHIPLPYDHFRKELELRKDLNPRSDYAMEQYVAWGYEQEDLDQVKEIFVSRMPTRKVKGKIHEETIRRKREIDNTVYAVVKTDLINLKIKNNEIEGYLEENKKSDPLLYNALLKRIKDNEYDIKKAFSTPFYKPKANGEQGPLVKKVKIAKEASNYVELKNKAIADSGSMVRIDVFEKNNKNYFVPIYVADVYKGILPNKVATAKKHKKDWKEIDDTYKFKFSLYPNDLIYIESLKGLKGKECLSGRNVCVTSMFAYYVGSNINSASIMVKSPDSSSIFEGIGFQGIKIEKYVIDVLGNVTKVGKEKRMPFALKHK